MFIGVSEQFKLTSDIIKNMVAKGATRGDTKDNVTTHKKTVPLSMYAL